MVPGAKKQVDVIRLKADLAALKVEMLSAQCAMDRVRLQYAPQDIIVFGEGQTLKRILASLQALQQFSEQIESQIQNSAADRPGS
jgi:NADPH-dependent 7-cyano-7-deazaguanine reductase QueF